MDQPLWQADKQRIARANLTCFMDRLRARHDLSLKDYAALHAWSLEEPEQFWSEVIHFTDVKIELGEGPVLRHPECIHKAEWFPEAKINFAENLLRFCDDQPALISASENGLLRNISYRELHEEVARIAAGLRQIGIEPGDRVAAFMPNLPETVIAMLASASVGAFFSSCSPDFGITGVMDRFGQIEPKVLITADGYFYAGKTIDSMSSIVEVLQKLPSVYIVLVVPYIGTQPNIKNLQSAKISARVILWSQFGSANTELTFIRLPFAHPLYILYSSGTTGSPKCIVHGAGGTLLQHLKEHILHVDLHRNDRLFYFTTCGWMMWNWLVSALATGATLILYDGSPLHPDPGVLWRLAQDQQITVFGTSPKYIKSLEKANYNPREHVSLPRLRTVLSTGSPLSAESFDFIYREVKSDLQLASISGGTDIVACFCLGNPIAPVYRGEIQCAALGMATDVVDAQGHSVAPCEKGELVCRQPFPSIPLGFWNDSDNTKFKMAYFSRYPGFWHHGDYAERTAHGGFIIHGRSDAVLNPGGVRIGTAEIYRQVDTLPEILESLCIGQQWQNDVRVVLFVRLRDGVVLDELLKARIRSVIRSNTTARHVPAKILEVDDIPRTLSGKIVELAVRNIVHGDLAIDTDALENPAALLQFQNRAELAE